MTAQNSLFQNKAPQAVNFPLSANDLFSFTAGHELFYWSRAPQSQAEVLGYAGNPSNRSHSTSPSIGISGGKARRWENKYSPPCPCKEVEKGPASWKQNAPVPAAKTEPVGIQLHKHFSWDNIQCSSLKAATYRSPKPVTWGSAPGPINKHLKKLSSQDSKHRILFKTNNSPWAFCLTYKHPHSVYSCGGSLRSCDRPLYNQPKQKFDT